MKTEYKRIKSIRIKKLNKKYKSKIKFEINI